MKKYVLSAAILILSTVTLGCNDDATSPNNNNTNGAQGSIFYSAAGTISLVDLGAGTETEIISNASSPDVVSNTEILALEGANRLMYTNMDGTSRQTLLERTGTGYTTWFNDPRISPDGRYVAYDGSVYAPFVYVVDAQNGELVATIGDPAVGYQMGDWLPDGSLVLERYSSPGIFVVQPDFTTITRIDPNQTVTAKPASNKDGKIAYVVNATELWTIDRDGSNPRRIVNDLYRTGFPVWNPAGTHVAISSENDLRIIDIANGSSDIYNTYISEDDRMDWR